MLYLCELRNCKLKLSAGGQKKLQEFQLSRKLKIKFEVCSDNDNSLHEKKQAWNDKAWIKYNNNKSICRYKVFQMQHLYDHISSGHEKKKPSNAAFATIALHQNEIWIIIFHQFMRLKCLSNAAFVMIILHQNKVCIIIHQFIKVNSPSNVVFVMTAFLFMDQGLL